MKQEITTDQWEEPTKDGKQKWREWSYAHGYVKEDKDGATMPMPTIGQMIHFLNERDSKQAIDRLGRYRHTVMQGSLEWEEYSSLDDLCDDLWGDVTKILDNER